MSPITDDVTEALRATARAFFEKESVPHHDRWAAQRHVDRAFWRQAAELGFLCLSIPEEYGGGGGTITEEIVLIEEQFRVFDFGWGNGVHSGIVAHYLLAYGSEDQKRRWLPLMATGECIAAIAMTEPGAGSDLQGIRTTAVPDGDTWVLNGSKTFISNGSQCDLVIVAAKTQAQAQARGKGVSLFIVDVRDCPGFERGRVLEKVGQHAADTSELFFTDVRIPAGNLLGEEGAGFHCMMAQLPRERLLLAAGAVVCAERAVEITTAYVKDRQAFGGSLFDKQHIRFELAECATLARVGRAFFEDCVARYRQDSLDSATAAMAKWWLSDMQCQVVDRCLQLFGGYGYMLEYPIARLWADSRPQRIYAGTNEIMKELIARSL